MHQFLTSASEHESVDMASAIASNTAVLFMVLPP